MLPVFILLSCFHSALSSLWAGPDLAVEEAGGGPFHGMT